MTRRRLIAELARSFVPRRIRARVRARRILLIRIGRLEREFVAREARLAALAAVAPALATLERVAPMIAEILEDRRADVEEVLELLRSAPR